MELMPQSAPAVLSASGRRHRLTATRTASPLRSSEIPWFSTLRIRNTKGRFLLFLSFSVWVGLEADNLSLTVFLHGALSFSIQSPELVRALVWGTRKAIPEFLLQCVSWMCQCLFPSQSWHLPTQQKGSAPGFQETVHVVTSVLSGGWRVLQTTESTGLSSCPEEEGEMALLLSGVSSAGEMWLS